MKKGLTVIVAIVLCAAFAVALTACNNDELNFGASLVSVTGQIDIFPELIARTADVGIMDSTIAYYYTSTDTYKDSLAVIPDLTLAQEYYGIAARQGAESTIYNINRALIALESDGTVDTIASAYGLESKVVIDVNANIGTGNATDTDWQDRIVGDGNKIVVGYTVFAPIAWTNQDGEFVGFDIDLAKAVGEYLGVAVEFKQINWNSKELELQSNSIDLIWNGLTITEERQQTMCISIPYLTNEQVAVVRVEDLEKYKTTDDMSDAVIVAEAGSAGESVVLKSEA